MIISHSRQFTFIHIHKAGGTSIEVALDPHLSWKDLILGSSPLGQTINSAYRARHRLHKHSSVADILKVCGPSYLESFYLFALVRHPVDRICSLYNFVGSLINAMTPAALVRQTSMPKGTNPDSIVQWPSSRVYMASASFSEFIRHEDLVLDIAFHPQTTRLRCPISGELKGDIFKLEDASSSMSKIQQRIGIQFALLHENKSERPLIEPRAVPVEDRRYLESKFRADFDAFGY
jgi:hypothetical protein